MGVQWASTACSTLGARIDSTGVVTILGALTPDPSVAALFPQGISTYPKTRNPQFLHLQGKARDTRPGNLNIAPTPTAAGAATVVISGHTSTQLRLDACGAGGRRLLAEGEGLALRVEAWPQGSQSPATAVPRLFLLFSCFRSRDI